MCSSSFAGPNILLQVTLLLTPSSLRLESITAPSCLSSVISFSHQSDSVHQAIAYCRCPLHSRLWHLMPDCPPWVVYSRWPGFDILFGTMMCFSSTFNTDPSLTLSQIMALDWISKKGNEKKWKRRKSCHCCGWLEFSVTSIIGGKARNKRRHVVSIFPWFFLKWQDIKI